MRINKYLAECGVCSRREADRLIVDGVVMINDRIAVLGDRVSDSDRILVRGELIQGVDKKVYIILNKPQGYICSTAGKKTVYGLVDVPERLFTIGRLDVASSGLLLLTNDGELSERLMRPEGGWEKEYEVEVKIKNAKRKTEKEKSEKSFDQFLKQLSEGVEIELRVKGHRLKVDMVYKTQSAKVARIGDRKFRIVLTEGKNRQIRKMCEVLGYQVKSLKRVRIGRLKLGDLKSGEWRELSEEEVRGVRGQTLFN